MQVVEQLGFCGARDDKCTVVRAAKQISPPLSRQTHFFAQKLHLLFKRRAL